MLQPALLGRVASPQPQNLQGFMSNIQTLTLATPLRVEHELARCHAAEEPADAAFGNYSSQSLAGVTLLLSRSPRVPHGRAYIDLQRLLRSSRALKVQRCRAACSRRRVTLPGAGGCALWRLVEPDLVKCHVTSEEFAALTFSNMSNRSLEGSDRCRH